jgi:hypothetical protein
MTIRTRTATPEYRRGWDETFGRKTVYCAECMKHHPAETKMVFDGLVYRCPFAIGALGPVEYQRPSPTHSR